MRTGFHDILEALASFIPIVRTEELFHVFIKPECLETGMKEDLTREVGDVMNGNHVGRGRKGI